MLACLHLSNFHLSFINYIKVVLSCVWVKNESAREYITHSSSASLICACFFGFQIWVRHTVLMLVYIYLVLEKKWYSSHHQITSSITPFFAKNAHISQSWFFTQSQWLIGWVKQLWGNTCTDILFIFSISWFFLLNPLKRCQNLLLTFLNRPTAHSKTASTKFKNAIEDSTGKVKGD